MASILVTGASRGIGLATCLSLGRAGHHVFATMRDPDRAPELGAVASTESLPITISAMDVDSDESVRKAVGQIIAPEPELVGDKIREIIESDSWQLRHPVGPDAEPFLDWRAAMTDEEWVDRGAADDEEWYAAVERDFGLDARSGN